MQCQIIKINFPDFSEAQVHVNYVGTVISNEKKKSEKYEIFQNHAEA